MHLCGNHQNDFIEMGLHHIATIYLLGGSYMLNVLECGAVIAWLHDASDICIMFAKVGGATIYKIPTVTLFIASMLIWAWTRNFAFTLCIYDVYQSWDLFMPTKVLRPIFVFLLSCLNMLHFYWQGMFISMLIGFFKTGDSDDKQNKVEAAEEEK